MHNIIYVRFFEKSIGKKYFKLFRRLRLILLGLVISVLVKLLIATAYIGLMTNGDRYVQPELVPKEQVAIVFGAGILPNGNPTPMLSDRVEAAVKRPRPTFLGRFEPIN
ncbi:hypothetical protein [Fischerella thermalis]|uniref:hypothetical protein n=1 Tax=Fischerella thermalis TaxID=372787 RepID=UPI00307DC777